MVAAATPLGRPRRTRLDGLLLVAAMAALMWLAEIADAVLPANLDAYGIAPRSDDGLTGVLLAPFLHGGFGHLVANTVPFVVMGAVIALGGLARVLAVTAIAALVSGLGTWLVAPSATVHVGASGVVFGYTTYLLTRGAFSRDLVHLGLGLVVLAFMGGVLLGGLLPQEGISWQGHLFGAVGGVVAARVLARRRGPAG